MRIADALGLPFAIKARGADISHFSHDPATRPQLLAAAERGGLLHAPDLYMEKIVVGPSSREAVSLDASVADNLGAIAECLGRRVTDLVVIVLDQIGRASCRERV